MRLILNSVDLALGNTFATNTRINWYKPMFIYERVPPPRVTLTCLCFVHPLAPCAFKTEPCAFSTEPLREQGEISFEPTKGEIAPFGVMMRFSSEPTWCKIVTLSDQSLDVQF